MARQHLTASAALRLALLLVLVGAALVLVAAGRTWVHVELAQPPPLPPRSEVRTGVDLAAGLRPLGLLGLAGVAALAATRGRGRVLLGLVLLAAGLAAAAAVLAGLRDGAAVGSGGTGTVWPYAGLLGATLQAAGGLVVAVRGPRWAGLSARYQVPADRPGTAVAPAGSPGAAAWDAFDRGEDPTTGPAEDGVPAAPGAPGDPGDAPPGARPTLRT